MVKGRRWQKWCDGAIGKVIDCCCWCQVKVVVKLVRLVVVTRLAIVV